MVEKCALDYVTLQTWNRFLTVLFKRFATYYGEDYLIFQEQHENSVLLHYTVLSVL